jgi:hypothetical protein
MRPKYAPSPGSDDLTRTQPADRVSSERAREGEDGVRKAGAAALRELGGGAAAARVLIRVVASANAELRADERVVGSAGGHDLLRGRPTTERGEHVVHRPGTGVELLQLGLGELRLGLG